MRIHLFSANSVPFEFVALLVAFSLPVFAQGAAFQVVPLPPPAEAPQETAAAVDSTGLEGTGKYAGGASLKTDPELLSRLKKAEQYQKDGNWRVATRLWQSVLDDCGDTLFTTDEETYYSLARRIEELLTQLPPEGLSAYRIAADSTAAGIMAAGGENNLDALGQIVRSYFLSSQGDEAAWQIGCIFLDQGDFGGARRMFSRILENYPDPTVPLDQVWLRMAVAHFMSGDIQGSRTALANALNAGGDPDDRLHEAVSAMLLEAESGRLPDAAMPAHAEVAGNRKIGVQPSVADPPSGKLRVHWQWWYAPSDTYSADIANEQVLSTPQASEHRESVSTTEQETIGKWRTGKWRPVPGVVISGDFLIWRSAADLVCGRLLPDAVPERIWRPIWLNLFEIDNASAMWKQMMDAYGQYGETSSQAMTAPQRIFEVQLFGDGVGTSMTRIGPVVYSIEGNEYSPYFVKRPQRPRQENSYNWGSIPRRSRTNFLTAYDAETGKLLWRQPGFRIPGQAADQNSAVPSGEAAAPAPAGGEDAGTGGESPPGPGASADPMEEAIDPMLDAGFMGAPVPFGSLIVVPATVNGSLFLYALDPANHGMLQWRVYLCDEPGNGSSFWSPMHVATSGSTIYATVGTGVVFAVDGVTRSIRLARRYPRTGHPNNLMERFGNAQELLDVDGWCEDLVVPMGNETLVLSSDYDAMWSMDGQTGKMIWRTDNRPFGQKFDYLIGIHGDLVFLGGREVVAAASLRGQGRWIWVYSLPGTSYGRAMVTSDALYVPVENSILKLGLHGMNGSGDLLATWKVELHSGAPVGNLYTDGRQFLVDGGNRLYGLADDPGTEGDDSAETADEDESDTSEPEEDGPSKENLQPAGGDDDEAQSRAQELKRGTGS